MRRKDRAEEKEGKSQAAPAEEEKKAPEKEPKRDADKKRRAIMQSKREEYLARQRVFEKMRAKSFYVLTPYHTATE